MSSNDQLTLMDGAMGTQLIQRSLSLHDSSILWNEARPDIILDIHRSYVEAGSQCLTTNTFSGSSIALDRNGLGDRFETLNRKAVELALTAANGGCKVFGDIGPCGDFLYPMGDLEPSDLKTKVRHQGAILADSGVNGFIVETMADPREMQATVEALIEFGLPIVATFTYEKNGEEVRTMMGTRPDQATRAAIEAGASIVGANCGTSLGLADYLDLLVEIRRGAKTTPVILQPNAGSPIADGDGFRYDLPAEEFAEWVRQAVLSGAHWIGGCCGTSPAHIAAASVVLNSLRISEPSA